MDNNELNHFGILGMRWGRRKGNTKRTQKTKINTSEDHKTAKKLSLKKVSSMTNSELQAYTLRKTLELGYANAKNKSKTPGRKMVDEFIKKSGEALISEVSKRSMDKIKDLINDKMKT